MTRIDRETRRSDSTLGTRAPTAPAAARAADAGADAVDIGALAPAGPADGVDRGVPSGAVDHTFDAPNAEIRSTSYELYGPPLAPRGPLFSSPLEAERALTSTFGVALKGEAWTQDEMERVYETLSVLGPVERAAVRGLELVRAEGTAPLGVGHGAEGVVGAVFSRGDGVNGDGARVALASITFYDAAFPASDKPEVDRQATMIATLHEVGHAIEGHAIGDDLAVRAGGARRAANVARFEDALNNDYKAAHRAVRARGAGGPLGDVQRAVTAWDKAYAQVGNAGLLMSEREAAARLLARAQADLERAAQSLPDAHSARAAVTALVVLNRAVADLQPGYLDGVRARDDAERLLIDRGVTLDDPETKGVDETLGAMEQEFAKHVAVTDYGKTSPVENFAEAYMLYKRDPARLRLQSEKSYAFFAERFPP